MDEYDKAMLSLLRRKKGCMLDLVRLATESLPKGEDLEQDADNFIEMVDAREGVVDRLKELEGEIKEFSSGESGQASPDTPIIEALRKDIRELAEEAARLDKETRKHLPGMLAYLQQKLKDQSNRKRITSMYDKKIPFEEGYYLDEKN